MGKYTLLQSALGFAAINWIAVGFKWKWLEYITKPATMLALLAWVFQLRPGLIIHGSINWLAVALIFSLAGDIFLMLPIDAFIPGLFSFLLAHMAYVFSFAAGGFRFNLAILIIVILVGVSSYQIFRQIAAGLARSGQDKLKIPVLTYTLVISLMVIMALQTLANNGWANYRALMISAGALLFLLSDVWIAWDRFVESLKWRDLRVMMTYHLGQMLIALGLVISF